jgi:hypothetical protein
MKILTKVCVDHCRNIEDDLPGKIDFIMFVFRETYIQWFTGFHDKGCSRRTRQTGCFNKRMQYSVFATGTVVIV